MALLITPEGQAVLERVAQWLEDGARHVLIDETGRILDHFDMNYGVQIDNDDESPSCGTSCCIAGAICQFGDLGVIRGGDLNFFNSGWGNTFQKGAGSLAAELISVGADLADLSPLFLPWDHFYDTRVELEDWEAGYSWDEELQECCLADAQAGWFNNPEAAAKVVRHFMATGVIDWTVGLENCAAIPCGDE